MEELLEKLDTYRKEIIDTEISGADAAEAYRIRFLGTKGIVKNLFQEMKNVPADKKKEFGQILNEFKQLAESKYAESSTLKAERSAPNTNQMDWSLPGDPISVGTRHPISIVKNRIIQIFGRLGFSVAEGPEIEDDWHNFTALNLPEDHPARDMQDTFYIHKNPDWLLRTHTSSVQARVMETQKPPIRIICPGRVYRNETISARAHCFFT
ncbi:MAG TPA: hypothetical protein VK622_14600, partial [Puia sp.]|nr:hypothetical protein [Puia sp.]